MAITLETVYRSKPQCGWQKRKGQGCDVYFERFRRRWHEQFQNSSKFVVCISVWIKELKKFKEPKPVVYNDNFVSRLPGRTNQQPVLRVSIYIIVAFLAVRRSCIVVLFVSLLIIKRTVFYRRLAIVSRNLFEINWIVSFRNPFGQGRGLFFIRSVHTGTHGNCLDGKAQWSKKEKKSQGYTSYMCKYYTIILYIVRIINSSYA